MKKISGLFRKKDFEGSIIPLSQMSTAISEWSSLYESKAYSDGENSLNLAAGICTELARLATIEFSSEISGGSRAEYINRQYQRVVAKARNFVEYACAEGGVILKPYIYKNEIYVSLIAPTRSALCAIYCRTFEFRLSIVPLEVMKATIPPGLTLSRVLAKK